MKLARKSIALVTFLFLFFSVGAAHAGSIEASNYVQQLCISGAADGTDWDYELRLPGNGPLICSGTGNVAMPGTNADIASATAAALNLGACDDGSIEVTAFSTPTPLPAALGLGDCSVHPGGPYASVVIIRSVGPGPKIPGVFTNFELAVEQNVSPFTLKVPTSVPFDPVSFNSGCVPTVVTNKPIVFVPEPGSLALLLSGGFGLIGLGRLRRR